MPAPDGPRLRKVTFVQTIQSSILGADEKRITGEAAVAMTKQTVKQTLELVKAIAHIELLQMLEDRPSFPLLELHVMEPVIGSGVSESDGTPGSSGQDGGQSESDQSDSRNKEDDDTRLAGEAETEDKQDLLSLDEGVAQITSEALKVCSPGRSSRKKSKDSESNSEAHGMAHLAKRGLILNAICEKGDYGPAWLGAIRDFVAEMKEVGISTIKVWEMCTGLVESLVIGTANNSRRRRMARTIPFGIQSTVLFTGLFDVKRFKMCIVEPGTDCSSD